MSKDLKLIFLSCVFLSSCFISYYAKDNSLVWIVTDMSLLQGGNVVIDQSGGDLTVKNVGGSLVKLAGDGTYTALLLTWMKCLAFFFIAFVWIVVDCDECWLEWGCS